MKTTADEHERMAFIMKLLRALFFCQQVWTVMVMLAFGLVMGTLVIPAHATLSEGFDESGLQRWRNAKILASVLQDHHQQCSHCKSNCIELVETFFIVHHRLSTGEPIGNFTETFKPPANAHEIYFMERNDLGLTLNDTVYVYYAEVLSLVEGNSSADGVAQIIILSDAMTSSLDKVVKEYQYVLDTYALVLEVGITVIVVLFVSLSLLVSLTAYYPMREALALQDGRASWLEFLVFVTAHEIRTPLSAMIVLTEESVERKTRHKKIKREDLELVLASSRRLENIVNSVLDVALLRRNLARIGDDRFVVSKAIDETILLFSGLAKSKGKKIVLRRNVDDGVWHRDERRFVQILTNLLSNAVKYSTREEIVVDVWLEHIDETPTLTLEVQNSCVSCERLTEITSSTKKDEYHRLLPNQDTRASAGLGLILCQALVSAYSGVLEVGGKMLSASESVASFTVRLPLLEWEDRPHILEMEPLAPGRVYPITRAMVPALSGISIHESPPDSQTHALETLPACEIIGADDNAINNRVLDRLIKRTCGGVPFRLYADGQYLVEELSRLDIASIKLVLLDLNMPIKGGVATVRDIRDIWGAAKCALPRIIAITGAVSQEEELKGLGFDDVLYKPLTHEKFQRALSSMTFRSSALAP